MMADIWKGKMMEILILIAALSLGLGSLWGFKKTLKTLRRLLESEDQRYDRLMKEIAEKEIRW